MSGGEVREAVQRLAEASAAWGSALAEVARAVAAAVAEACRIVERSNKGLRQAASMEDARREAVKRRRRAKALARSRRNIETLKKEGRCR